MTSSFELMTLRLWRKRLESTRILKSRWWRLKDRNSAVRLRLWLELLAACGVGSCDSLLSAKWKPCMASFRSATKDIQLVDLWYNSTFSIFDLWYRLGAPDYRSTRNFSVPPSRRRSRVEPEWAENYEYKMNKMQHRDKHRKIA